MSKSTVQIKLPSSIGGLNIPASAANTPQIRALMQKAAEGIDKEFLQNSTERPIVIGSMNNQAALKIEVRNASPILKQQMEAKLNLQQK